MHLFKMRIYMSISFVTGKGVLEKVEFLNNKFRYIVWCKQGPIGHIMTSLNLNICFLVVKKEQT